MQVIIKCRKYDNFYYNIFWEFMRELSQKTKQLDH